MYISFLYLVGLSDCHKKKQEVENDLLSRLLPRGENTVLVRYCNYIVLFDGRLTLFIRKLIFGLPTFRLLWVS